MPMSTTRVKWTCWYSQSQLIIPSLGLSLNLASSWKGSSRDCIDVCVCLSVAKIIWNRLTNSLWRLWSVLATIQRCSSVSYAAMICFLPTSRSTTIVVDTTLIGRKTRFNHLVRFYQVSVFSLSSQVAMLVNIHCAGPVRTRPMLYSYIQLWMPHGELLAPHFQCFNVDTAQQI